MEGIYTFRIKVTLGGYMKRRLKFPDISECSGFPKETKKRKKMGLLPLISFLGIGLMSLPLFSRTFPQNKQSAKITMKSIKKAKIATAFSTSAKWDIRRDSFSVSKTFLSSDKKVAVSAVMISEPLMQNSNKRSKRFLISRFLKRKKEWKRTDYFIFKLNELDKHHLPNKQLKGCKIFVDDFSKPSILIFYIIPDNGAAAGLHKADPVTVGLPVAVFEYDRANIKARYLGVKKIVSP